MARYARRLVPLAAALLLAGCASAQPAASSPPEATSPAATGQATEPTQNESPPEGTTAFQVDSGQSEVRFVIGEILAGQPNTVTGVNRQVTGSAQVSLSQPGDSRLGQFQIEAAGFRTDSSLRDRAINQFILQSESFPTIVFTPTAVTGLPESASTGDNLTVQITGDLTIRHVTRQVSFAVELSVISDSHLQATGSATIARADYDLQIPQVPRVAGVDEELTLEIDLLLVAG